MTVRDRKSAARLGSAGAVVTKTAPSIPIVAEVFPGDSAVPMAIVFLRLIVAHFPRPLWQVLLLES